MLHDVPGAADAETSIGEVPVAGPAVAAMAAMADTTGPDAGAPPSWRIEAIEALGLGPAERRASASPSPAFPAMLEFIVGSLGRSRPRRIVEIGAGLGGITDAVRERTGISALAIDHSVEACVGVRRLFHELTSVAARGIHLPIRSGAMGAALLSGVLSRTTDLAGLLAEARRVISATGLIVIVDLVSSDDSDRRVGADVFRSIESIESSLPAGLDVVDRAIGAPRSGEWNLQAAEVARHIARTHRRSPGFETWLEHQRHLDRVLSGGDVLVAALVATPTPNSGF